MLNNNKKNQYTLFTKEKYAHYWHHSEQINFEVFWTVENLILNFYGKNCLKLGCHYIYSPIAL